MIDYDRADHEYDQMRDREIDEQLRARKPQPCGHLVPNRSVRVPDDLWAQFGAACEAAATDRCSALKRFISDVIEKKRTLA